MGIFSARVAFVAIFVAVFHGAISAPKDKVENTLTFEELQAVVNKPKS